MAGLKYNIYRTLQVSPCGLVPLDRLEKSLEITLSKTLSALTLDNLEEQGRPVLYRFGEDLKQIAFVIPVNQDTQLFQRREILIDLPYPLNQIPVIGGRHLQEFHSTVPQPGNRFHDIGGSHRHMLYPFPLIKLQVFLDLRFLFPLRRLIDREFHD